jgi:hypothetical protein
LFGGGGGGGGGGGDGPVVTNGLISYYTFNDGNATDTVGTNDATVNGATFDSVGGPQGDGAYSFDGVDDVIDIGRVSELGGGLGNNYTLTAWVKPLSNDLDGSLNQVIGKQGPDGLDTYRFGINNNEFYFLAADDTGRFDSIETSVAPSAGTWYMITGRYTDGDIEIFVDAVSEASKLSGLSSASDNYNNVSIGASSSANKYYVHSVIDNVRFYDRSLSQSEIQTIYDVEK